MQAPPLDKVVWYQHLVPCLIPTIHRLPVSLHLGLAVLPTPESCCPSLVANCCHQSFDWDCASPQHSFQKPDPGPARHLSQPRGAPAFQAKSEVWPKEATASLISVPMAMPAGRCSDLQCLPDHRAHGDVKRNHRKYHRGWGPAVALCLLARTDPAKANAPQGCICVTHKSRAASSVTAPVPLSGA